MIIASTLHKVGPRILHIFLPGFRVGGRSRYHPESEIPDDKSFSRLPQHSLISEVVYLYWGKEGNLTPALNFYALCAM